MGAQSQPTGNKEVAKKIEEQKSNLSPTAQLVNGMLKGLKKEGKKFIGIMPALRDSKLVLAANEIIKESMQGKLQPDDPKVIAFSLDCRKMEAKLSMEAREYGCTDQQLAVITNFMGKTIASVKSPAPETPTQVA